MQVRDSWWRHKAGLPTLPAKPWVSRFSIISQGFKESGPILKVFSLNEVQRLYMRARNGINVNNSFINVILQTIHCIYGGKTQLLV